MSESRHVESLAEACSASGTEKRLSPHDESDDTDL